MVSLGEVRLTAGIVADFQKITGAGNPPGTERLTGTFTP
jgi:hypothetical protein